MNTDIDLFEEIVSVPIRKAQFSVMPKFSFVIPSYTRGELLRYAIESILIQVAGENVEILIGDNNPERQDITEQYVSSLTDNRISYYKHQKNLGAAGNWTRVCQLAQGEWIIMLHDDDMLYSDYFACLKKVMSAYPYNDIVGIFPTFNSAAFQGTDQPQRTDEQIRVRYIHLEDFLEGCVLACPIGMCIRKKAFLQIKGYDTKAYPSIDYDFYVRLVQVGKIIKQYGYPTATWRIQQNDSMNKSVMLDCVRQVSDMQDKILTIRHQEWLKSLLKRRNRVFHNQHVAFWYNEMRHTQPEQGDLVDCSWFDDIIFKFFRIYFVLHRHLRIGGKTIK